MAQQRKITSTYISILDLEKGILPDQLSTADQKEVDSSVQDKDDIEGGTALKGVNVTILLKTAFEHF